MVIDTVVHPLMRRNELLREYMTEPLRRLAVGGAYRSICPAPTGEAPYGEFLTSARPPDADPDDLPGSHPSVILQHLDANDIEAAILVPLTRGLNANPNHQTAICSATNRWLAEAWLGEWNAHRRFYGSICVNPRDPEAAVTEIRRWAKHPAMVQVVVPALVHAPYGQRTYHPIWAEATEWELAVAVRVDGGGGLEFPPTPVGYPRLFVEYASLASASFAPHLASLIAEGVFERYPRLKFVFVDGGHDLLTQLIWRMDTTFPSCRGETPWVRRLPSEYLAEHVRFVSARHETPDLDSEALLDWSRLSRMDSLMMFGSHFPHWTTMRPTELLEGLPAKTRRRILSDNARELYGERLQIAPRNGSS